MPTKQQLQEAAKRNALQREAKKGKTQAERAQSQIKTAQQGIRDIREKGASGDVGQLEGSIEQNLAIAQQDFTAEDLAKRGMPQRGQLPGETTQEFLNRPGSGANQAQREAFQSVSSQPTSQPAEQEQNLAKEIARLTQENQGLTQEKQAREKELFNVSEQVSGFSQQLQAQQTQLQSLVNNLNSQKQGLGTQVNDILNQIAQSGTSANLNDGTLGMIESMARSTPPDQLMGKINQLVQNIPSVSPTTPIVAPAPSVDPFQEYKSLKSGGATASQIMTQNPELSSYIQPDGTVLNKEFGVSLNQTPFGEAYTTPTGLSIPRNQQTGFADFTALTQEEQVAMSYIDPLSIILSTGITSANTKAFYNAQYLNSQAQKNARDTAVYAQEINNFFNSQTNRINESKLADLQEIELEKSRQQLGLDTSMRSLNDAHSRTNNIMKAMVDAYGLEGSSAQLHIMSAMDLKFQQEINSTQRGYDINMASLANSTTRVKMNYANRLIEINNEKFTAFDKLRNQYIDTQDSISNSRLLSQLEKEDSIRNAYKDYSIKRIEREQKAQELAQKEAEAHRKEIFEQQKFYTQQMGYLVQIDEDGNIEPILDKAGNTIMTSNAKQFYERLALDRVQLTENEFGEPVIFDKITKKFSPLGNINPNNNFPYKGIEEQGDFSIRFGDFEIINGQVFDGDGQCVGGARQIIKDLPSGLDNIIDKRGVYSGIKDKSDIQAGDVLFFNGGDSVTSRFSGTTAKTGHAFVAESIDYENQTVRGVDVNYNGDNKWGVRTFKFDQIDRDPETGNLGVFRSANPIVPEISGKEKGYSNAQLSVLENIDPSNITKENRRTLRDLGLSQEDLFQYNSEQNGIVENEIDNLTKEYIDLGYSKKEAKAKAKANVGDLLDKRKTIEMQMSENQTAINTIDETLEKFGLLSQFTSPTIRSGISRQIFSNIGGTEAYNMNANIDTIRAIIGFDKLQRMRDASKTGGALGQVSERENTLLQSVLGSTKLGQDNRQLVENLKQIKESLQKINEAAQKDLDSVNPSKNNTDENDQKLIESQKKQAPKGQILIERNGQRGYIPENELLPTDKKL